MASISSAALAIVKRMQQNELTESVIYEKISAFAIDLVARLAKRVYFIM